MTSFVSDPRNLTKEKLKSALSKNSIPLPPKDSRKDVYVDLYREHLSPRSQTGKSHGEQLNSFSSDEEDGGFGSASPPRKRKPGSIGRANMGISTKSGVTDVTQLSDEELFSALKTMGVDVGPIQDTTREVYRRKLQTLLANGGVHKKEIDVEEQNGEEEEEDYSDQEEEEEEEETQVLNANDIAELEKNNVRRRTTQVTSRSVNKVINVVNNKASSKTETVETEKEITVDSDGKVKTDETTTTSSSVDGKTVSSSTVSTKKKGMPLWIQVCLLAAAALVVFIILASMESSSVNPV